MKRIYQLMHNDKEDTEGDQPFMLGGKFLCSCPPAGLKADQSKAYQQH